MDLSFRLTADPETCVLFSVEGGRNTMSFCLTLAAQMYGRPQDLKEPKDPGSLMLSLIREGESRLTINLISRTVVFKSLELDMMPARLALYAFFAMQKKDCSKEVENCGSCTDCFLDIQSIYEKQGQITDLYKKTSRGRPLDEMSDSGITGLSAENFNMYKGKIKSEFFNRFGPYALKELEIASVGTRPNTRYGIRMDREKMEIVY